MSDIKKQVYSLVEHQGLSQKQAAERLGVHPSTVSRYYHDVRLSESKISRGQLQQEFGSVGQSESALFSALGDEEYLGEVRFPTSNRIYDKMRRSDAQAQAMVLVIELPLRATKWYIEPYSEDAKDVEIAEAIEENLFAGPPVGMSIHWDDFLRLALTMLVFGYSIFEKVYKLENGLFKWKKFAVRPQRTIHDFLYDETGGPAGVKHLKVAGSSFEYVDIPIEKLLVFSYRSEGGDMRGQSIFRPAYKHWKIKDFLYKIVNIGIERNYVGTPTMQMPEEYSEQDLQKARQLVEDLRSADKGGAIIPPNFVLDLFEGKRGLAEALPYIEHHDVMMVRSILAQFINLGSKEVGSYALSSDQSDMFLMCLNATAEYIKNTINSFAIPQLVDYNWEVEGYPTINFEPIGKESKALVEVVKSLAAGKLIVPDDNLEEWLRDLLELPEKGEPLQQQPEQDQQQDIQGQETGHLPGKGNCCLHTLQERKQARTFADNQRRWRRQLTAYEKRVNLQDIEQTWDSEEQKLIDKGKELTKKQLDELFKAMRKSVDAGDYHELAAIPMKYRGDFAKFMGQQYRDLFDYGKEQGAAELNIDKDKVPTPNEQRRIAASRSELAADSIAQRVKQAAILTCLNAIRQGLGPKQALHRARQEADQRADRELTAAASAHVGGAINDGRERTAQEAGVELAQFSAILDDVVCPLCEWLDGLIIELTNPDFDVFTPQVHNNCRCVWVFILPDEVPQPEPTWETPPDGLVERHGNLVI